mgnify:CR=1 FL=1
MYEKGLTLLNKELDSKICNWSSDRTLKANRQMEFKMAMVNYMHTKLV